MFERFFMYSDRFQLSASQTAYDQRILLRENADFIMRGLDFYASSNAVGARLRRPDSSFFTGNEFFHLTGLCNTGAFPRPHPIYPELVWPKSSAFVFDLRDIGGAGDTNVYPVFWGVERYPDGALPSAPLPPKYVEQDYTITVTKTLTGADAQALDIPVTCDTGDPFAIRLLSFRYLESAAEPLTMACRLWDEYGRLYMNNWVPVRKLFAGPTEANEPYWSAIFPQMVIPANGAYKLDLWNRTEVGTYTVELAFKGVRLIPVQG